MNDIREDRGLGIFLRVIKAISKPAAAIYLGPFSTEYNKLLDQITNKLDPPPFDDSKATLLHDDYNVFAMEKSHAAQRFVQDLYMSRALATQWRLLLKKLGRGQRASQKAALTDWLKARGYTTPGGDVPDLGEVEAAFEYFRGASLVSWATKYNLMIDGKWVGTLEIGLYKEGEPVDGAGNVSNQPLTSSMLFQPRDENRYVVKYNSHAEGTGEPVYIKNWNYTDSHLSWAAKDGNPNNANLNLTLLTHNRTEPVMASDYLGPELSGLFWEGNGPAPVGCPLVVGRVNQHTFDPAHPQHGDDVAFWANDYATVVNVPIGTKTWVAGPSMTVADAGSGAAWNGVSITGVLFTQNTITWSDASNPTNGSLVFFNKEWASSTKHITGPQFFGKVWNKGEPKPAASNVFGHLEARVSKKHPDGPPSALGEALHIAGQAVQVGMLAHLTNKFLTWLEGPAEAETLAVGEAETVAASDSMQAANLVYDTVEAPFLDTPPMAATQIGEGGEVLFDAGLEVAETAALETAEVAGSVIATGEGLFGPTSAGLVNVGGEVVATEVVGAEVTEVAVTDVAGELLLEFLGPLILL